MLMMDKIAEKHGVKNTDGSSKMNGGWPMMNIRLITDLPIYSENLFQIDQLIND